MCVITVNVIIFYKFISPLQLLYSVCTGGVWFIQIVNVQYIMSTFVKHKILNQSKCVKNMLLS